MLVVFLVDAYGFEVFCLEHLVTIETAYIVDAIATCQNFGFLMLAGVHTKGDYFPILVTEAWKSSPSSRFEGNRANKLRCLPYYSGFRLRDGLHYLRRHVPFAAPTGNVCLGDDTDQTAVFHHQ